MNRNRGRQLLLLAVVALQLVIPGGAAASIHYVVLAPLLKSGQHLSSKDSSELLVASSTMGMADFLVFPPGSSPVGSSAWLNADYFATSPSIAFVDDVPRLARVTFAAAPSRAMLTVTGAKDRVTIEALPADEAMGTGFEFPLGDPGQRTTVYIGNPNAFVSQARVRPGGPTAPPKYVQQLPPWGVAKVVLDSSDGNKRVQVDTDSPVIVILETIDAQGNISWTFFRPG